MNVERLTQDNIDKLGIEMHIEEKIIRNQSLYIFQVNFFDNNLLIPGGDMWIENNSYNKTIRIITFHPYGKNVKYLSGNGLATKVQLMMLNYLKNKIGQVEDYVIRYSNSVSDLGRTHFAKMDLNMIKKPYIWDFEYFLHKTKKYHDRHI